ncbi:MAG: MazG nucleotide pyrophosphohydrolase domain-containing protein [Elusimicrobiota bacterium]
MSPSRAALFEDLVRLMARLRAPGGCPWDRKQTHRTLLRYLREESKEVEVAVKRRDWANLQDELGDLLLQVLFHAEIASGAGRFDIRDVMESLRSKLIRRHPHVFGDAKKEVRTARDVLKKWAQIKAAEARFR